MIITDVTTIKLRYRMDVAMADGIHYMPERPALLVQVHTDEGIVGLGEAAAYGGFLESTEALVTGELRRTILGQDQCDTPSHQSSRYSLSAPAPQATQAAP